MLRKTWVVLGVVALITITHIPAFAIEEVQKPVIEENSADGTVDDTNNDGVPGSEHSQAPTGHSTNLMSGQADVLIGVSWDVWVGSPVYLVDPNTGETEIVGPSGFKGLNSLARSRSGELHSVTDHSFGGMNGTLIKIDPLTGAGTAVADLSLGDEEPDIRALAFSPDDVLYAIQSRETLTTDSPDHLYTLDVQSGVGTYVGPTGLKGIQALDFSRTGVLYGWDSGGGDDEGQGLVTLDLETGRATDVNVEVGADPTNCPRTSFSDFIQSIVFTPSGRLLGGYYRLSEIDVTDGARHEITPCDTPYLDGIRGLEIFADTILVKIEIKPDGSPNSVNPRSRGAIPVAILGSESFDVANLDETTLRFGPDAAPIAHLHAHFEDVNLDGIMDLVTHYRTQETGIACGDESATLTGETLYGDSIEGTDSIQTVGCRETRRPAIWMKDQDRPDTVRRDGPVNIERK